MLLSVVFSTVKANCLKPTRVSSNSLAPVLIIPTTAALAQACYFETCYPSRVCEDT